MTAGILDCLTVQILAFTRCAIVVAIILIPELTATGIAIDTPRYVTSSSRVAYSKDTINSKFT